MRLLAPSLTLRAPRPSFFGSAGNNWWVGWLAFGEGWHNNHHAFEYSARHGLRPRQFDITFAIINLLRRVGLVHSVKLPTANALKRLAFDPESLYIPPETAK